MRQLHQRISRRLQTQPELAGSAARPTCCLRLAQAQRACCLRN
jgi:hypothetical protein